MYDTKALIEGFLISIHSLREEGDKIGLSNVTHIYLFQSTPSVRRETIDTSGINATVDISIHSLREEGDT